VREEALNVTAGESADWHSLSAADALDRLGSRAEGLSAPEVAARAERFGPNALAEEKREGFLHLLLRHVANPVIYVLCAAVAVSALTGHLIDAAAIFAVILLNTALGMVQEARAEKALAALQKLAAPRARLRREDRLGTVLGFVAVGLGAALFGIGLLHGNPPAPVRGGDCDRAPGAGHPHPGRAGRFPDRALDSGRMGADTCLIINGADCR